MLRPQLVSDRYSSYFINQFVSALGSLPGLKVLSIAFDSDEFASDFSLEPISDLSSITVELRTDEPPTSHIVQEISNLLSRSPNLESLIFEMHERYRVDNTPSLSEIFRSLDRVSIPSLRLERIKLFGVSVVDFITYSRHFKSLRVFEALSAGDAMQCSSSFARICHWLKDERVHLKHFAAESIHPPEIFRYLTSYSGLEHLCLHPVHSDDDSTELLDRFFFTVIPLHRHTLRSLKFGTHTPTAWTKLNEKHLEQIGMCTSLREIWCWICCETPGGALTDKPIVGHPPLSSTSWA